MEFKFSIGKREKKEKKERFCIKCGLKLPEGRSRKFCNVKCRTRYYSLKQYNRFKKDPIYIKKRRKYHKEWRLKNHDRFNELMRESSKKYQRKISAEKKRLKEN